MPIVNDVADRGLKIWLFNIMQMRQEREIFAWTIFFW